MVWDDKVCFLMLYGLQGSDSNGSNKEKMAVTGINETEESSLLYKGESTNKSTPE